MPGSGCCALRSAHARRLPDRPPERGRRGPCPDGHPAKDVASSAAGTSSADAAEPSAATDAPAPQAPTADAPLNLNTAAKEELMLLPRIGETLAERILAYRAENGSFVSTEQLMDIDGIGEGTYNSIRDLVTVEDNP